MEILSLDNEILSLTHVNKGVMPRIVELSVSDLNETRNRCLLLLAALWCGFWGGGRGLLSCASHSQPINCHAAVDVGKTRAVLR